MTPRPIRAAADAVRAFIDDPAFALLLLGLIVATILSS